MKVTIDPTTCAGHARCAEAGPALFRLDDLGYAIPIDEDVPVSLKDAARAGAAACPEDAITVV
jgi:ferredoxin